VTEPEDKRLVLDVVLMPPADVARRSIQMSTTLAPYGTEFVLDDVTLFGHLSMYMGGFEPAAVPRAVGVLTELAAATPPLELTAERYLQDVEQGMIEVAYRKTPAVTDLQERIIAGFNPLRTGLRHADPVGRVLAEWLPATTGETRSNLDSYGYDEIGGLFRPHVTFTRFRRRDLLVDLASLPPLEQFSGTFGRLGLYEMGEHGTCTRRVAEVDLAG
jgi:hypothetical protein